MRSIWKGTIGFGLVNIPVRLYSAIEDNRPDFDWLDQKDHSPVHYKRVNEKTGKEVPWEQIVKAAWYHDKYVVLSERDFERASPEQTKTIAIEQFAGAAEIDSIYYDTPYYLQPDASGKNAYTLLRDALEKTGKVAIGRFVLRTREHLAIIRPGGKMLILIRIRYQSQIRKAPQMELAARRRHKNGEMKLAVSLINQLSGKFDPSAFRDQYSRKLNKLIRDKAKGKKTKVTKLRVAHKQKGDLMKQLKESLQSKNRKAS